jgi:uncharacterized membrane protein YbaN (DUF454 family)
MPKDGSINQSAKINSLKILFITLGFICLILGISGLVIPGLPTTPFILLAGYFFLKSSEKLHKWLLSRKYIGKPLRNYNEKKAFTKKTIIFSVILMWIMISASIIFLIENKIVQISVFLIGIIGTIFMMYLKKYDE